MSDTNVPNPSQYTHAARANMLPFVPLGARRILDVGCNTGGFGQALKLHRPVEVWGLEPNAAAAAIAAQYVDHLVVDFFTAHAAIPDRHFDVLVFNDVLEHFVDPWEALQLAKTKLREGGCVVASIPNLLHQENLLHILREQDFRYEPVGIRDRTHLRFFTRKSAVRMFEESGYVVSQVQGINSIWWTRSLARRLIYKVFSRQLEDTKYLQFAFVAKPDVAA